jgi:UDP:flavonoid glycosyltransferase YjiC (YdhE family)
MNKPLKTIALILEMGAGLGHIATFLPIAKALKHNGYRPVLIVRDVSQVELMYADEGIEYIQAPVWLPVRADASRAQLNFTDSLFHFGYLDGQSLTSMLKAWVNLFNIIKPDVFIFDYAPTALLASKVTDTPKIIFGNCFSIPPKKSPMPAYMSWKDNRGYEEKILKEEKTCVANINYALRSLKASPISSVSEIYSSDYCFITTDPLLDIYPREKDKVEHLGAIISKDIGLSSINWPMEATATPKIFIYLKPRYQYADELLLACSSSEAQYIIYSPRLPLKSIEKYQANNIAFSYSPVNIQEIKKECDGAIIHGGNLIDSFLKSGIPLLLLPTQMENLLMSRQVVKHGAGICSHLADIKIELTDLLKRLIVDKKLKVSAATLADKMLDMSQEDQVEKVVEKCIDLMS